MSTPVKFLLSRALVNTLLFTMAKLYDLSIVWVVLVELVAFAIFVVIRAMTSRAAVLQKQALLMGWEFLTMQRDPGTGYKDAVFERNGVLARVSYDKGTISLVGQQREFDSLAELEEWLAQTPKNRNGV